MNDALLAAQEITAGASGIANVHGTFPSSPSWRGCRLWRRWIHVLTGQRSIIFERPTTGLSNPDAADSSPGLNLALYGCESGADEAR
jgi:hypothetical protein